MEQKGTRREAIVEAMIRVGGTKGYLATSVADVMEEAGVSRTTFYKHFANKQTCFLAAYELAAERIFITAHASCQVDLPWRERSRRGLGSIVELLAADPPLARTAIVEGAIGGAAVRRRHMATLHRLAQLLEGAGGAGRRADLPTSTALMAVSATVALIFDQLREGQAADLPALLPELEFALLVPFIGPRAAAEAYAASDAPASV